MCPAGRPCRLARSMMTKPASLLLGLLGDPAGTTGMGQEILQLCFGVRNPLRKTDMIQLVQRGQVAWFTTAQLDHDLNGFSGSGQRLLLTSSFAAL